MGNTSSLADEENCCYNSMMASSSTVAELSSYDEFLTEFNRILLEESYDLNTHLDIATTRDYKGVKSLDGATIHVVKTQQWTAFRNAVLDSSLTHAEKMVFIDQGVHYKLVRELHHDLLENHPTWDVIDSFYTQQNAIVEEFEATALENTGSVEKLDRFHDVMKIYLPASDNVCYVLNSELADFVVRLELKRETQYLSEVMPETVFSHLRSRLDKRREDYIGVISPEKSYDAWDREFIDMLEDNHVDVSSKPSVFSPSAHIVYSPPEGEQIYVVNSVVVDSFFNSLYSSSIFQSKTNTWKVPNEEYYHPLMAQHPSYAESLRIVENIIQIRDEFCATYAKQVRKKRSKVRHVLSFPTVTLDVYQKVIQDLYAADTTSNIQDVNFSLIFNLTNDKIKEALLPVLKYFIHKSSLYKGDIVVDVPYRQVQSLHLKPVKDLSEELLAEFQVCGRKTAYRTAEQAWAERVCAGKSESSVYHCSYCGHYHYGVKSYFPQTLEEQAEKGRQWYLECKDKADRFALIKNLI